MFICTVCGEHGAGKCTEVDENGNPVGGYVHYTCANETSIGAETQHFRGTRHTKIPGIQKHSMSGMRHKRSKIHKFLVSPLQRMQKARWVL